MLTRRNFLEASAALPIAAAFAQNSNGKLANAVLDPAAAKLTRQSFGEVRIYFDGATDQLSAMTAGSVVLRAGMAPHPAHQHPEEEIMLVTDGSGEIMVDGHILAAATGAMMYCAGGRMHGITAGPQGLTFYFYKWKV